MQNRTPSLEERVAELETQFQILNMAIDKDDHGSQHHLGRVFLRMGLHSHYYRQYYRFLNVATGDPSLDDVLAAWKQHFPHHHLANLLEIGIAMYLSASGPASRLFMEAALRGIRLEETYGDGPPVTD